MSGSFAQQIPSGLSPFTAQGSSTFPGAFPPQALGTNPFGSYAPQFGNYAPSPFSAYGTSFAPQPLQQLVQSLLIVPQQLQHLLQLAQIQQQQVQYLLQSIPQHIQQLQLQLQQQQQSLHQPAFQSFNPQQHWGSTQIPLAIPQPFGSQSAHVM